MGQRVSDKWRSQKLRQDVMAAIESGRWKPGQLVPSVRKLGVTYGISHVAASLALNKLVEAGCVVKRRGAGTFVADTVRRVPGVLDVHWMYPPSAPRWTAIERFKTAFPEVTLRFSRAPQRADVLILGHTGMASGIQGHYLQPLEAFMERSGVHRDEFLPATAQVGMVGDRVYGLPFCAGIECLIYNRTLLEPGERRTINTWSLDDLMAFAARRQGDLGKRGIRPLAVKRSFMDETRAYLAQFGARIFDAATGPCGLASPACLAAFEYGRDLGRQMPTFVPGAQCGLADLQEGRLAVWHSGSTAWGNLSNRHDFALAPMPYGRHPAGWITGDWLCIGTGSAHPELSWQFIRHLISPPEQSRLAADGVAFPGRRSAVEALLKKGAGNYDLIIRPLLTQSVVADYVCAEEEFFIDAHLGNWREAADLPAVLAECAKLVDARRFTGDPSCADHPGDGERL